MQKRIFIGISLPEDIKKRLFRVVEKEYGDLPVKWVQKNNLHLTLNFLGYTQEEKIPELCDAIREALAEQENFELEFVRIEVGPSEKSRRLIWITGKVNNELNKLKNKLDNKLGSAFTERRKFIPHITLARIKRGGKELSQPELNIKKEIIFAVPVNSLELFESRYEKGKRVYYVMESFPLK